MIRATIRRNARHRCGQRGTDGRRLATTPTSRRKLALRRLAHCAPYEENFMSIRIVGFHVGTTCRCSNRSSAPNPHRRRCRLRARVGRCQFRSREAYLDQSTACFPEPPVTGGNYPCYEAQVVTIGSDSFDPGSSALKSALSIRWKCSDADPRVLLVCKRQLEGVSGGQSYFARAVKFIDLRFGLRCWASRPPNYINANVTPGVLSNYSAVHPHRPARVARIPQIRKALASKGDRSGSQGKPTSRRGRSRRTKPHYTLTRNVAIDTALLHRAAIGASVPAAAQLFA
jgi:hypothetical protein